MFVLLDIVIAIVFVASAVAVMNVAVSIGSDSIAHTSIKPIVFCLHGLTSSAIAVTAAAAVVAPVL